MELEAARTPFRTQQPVIEEREGITTAGVDDFAAGAHLFGRHFQAKNFDPRARRSPPSINALIVRPAHWFALHDAV